MIQESFQFSLHNDGAIVSGYKIYLEDVTTGEKLDTNLVRYYLTKDGQTLSGPESISVLEANNYLIEEGAIAAGGEYSYELRLWIDFNVIDDTLISGKSLHYKIKLEANQSSGNEDLILSATLDGAPVVNFPTAEDNYGVESVTCDNEAIGTFKTTDWSIVVENFTTTGTTCTANFLSTLTPETSNAKATTTSEEMQKEVDILNDGKDALVDSLVAQGVSGLNEASTLSNVNELLSATNMAIVGSSTEIMNSNSHISGGWSGSKSASYNYSSLPSFTYTTQNIFSFTNISSVIATASFGYYVDEGKTESAKLTVNIINTAGTVVATKTVTSSKSGFTYGSVSMSATVDTSAITENCQIQIVFALTSADGSHVTSSSSLSSCYLQA